MLGAVGCGEHEDLAALFNAVEQDQELGDGRDLVLGTLGRARGGNRVYLVEQDDSWREFLRSLEDVSDCSFGPADPFGQGLAPGLHRRISPSCFPEDLRRVSVLPSDGSIDGGDRASTADD